MAPPTAPKPSDDLRIIETGPYEEGVRRLVGEMTCPDCSGTFRGAFYELEADTRRVPASNYARCADCANTQHLGTGAWHPVGAGWMPLVLEAHERLRALDPDYRIGQIKEKYGTLRFYFDQSPFVDDAVAQKMFEIENDVEDRSAKLCERCGKPGEADDSSYWILTLCDEHRAERAAKAQTN